MTKIHASHLITFAVVGLAATFVSLGRAVPQTSVQVEDSTRLAARISAATGLAIRSDAPISIVGIGRTGLKSALFWQEVLFLGGRDKSKSRDLYRAEIRINREHGILALRNLKNLTDSPAGDEYQLIVSPPYAAVATRALGQVRSLTLLDFRGRPRPDGAEWSIFTRFLACLTDLLETGHIGGVAKTTVRFARPPTRASLSFVTKSAVAKKIAVTWTDRKSRPRRANVNILDSAPDYEELIATIDVRLPKRPILWIVDTVRSFSWIGPGPIEWAEGRFFSIQDAYRRLIYSLTGDETLTMYVDTSDTSEPQPIANVVPSGLEVGNVTPNPIWPPPAIKPPVFKRVAHGEGIWQPESRDFLRTLPGAPPAIYHSYTRPDRERPYVRVHLFAMDMRQFDLHMVGGYEDPKPTTGSQGTGRIPRRREILSRLVVAFNGAFKTEHGAYGMMVERDILLPPQDDAATIASLEDGRTVMGSWPIGMTIPTEMISLRQNMDPLLENGVVNPRRRYLWGFTLDEDITNMHTIRSGFCMTESGVLIYGWGEDLTARTLGVAMNAAGCVYGIHLDMNPFHTAFIYYRFADSPSTKRPSFQAALALKEMRFSPNRYVNGAPKDFFFLTLKDSTPDQEWSSSGLAQPAPAFVPAVFKQNKGQCQMIAIDMTRASVEILPGRIPLELAPVASQPNQNNVKQVLATVRLGQWSFERGQLVDGTVVSALTPDRATLALDEFGALAIGMWPLETKSKSPTKDAIQSRWLIPGTPTSERVATIALKGDHWLLLAQGPGDELAGIMKKQGITHALAFNLPETGPVIAVRGEHGMVIPSGKPTPTRDLPGTALRIIARPRPLGMTRLEDVFGRGGTKANE
ncbi:MAG: hypothetical protein GY847_25635 [Proteobacteria bacterium]|nr:hypothetical protein [Pseudomonadota bacterium]